VQLRRRFSAELDHVHSAGSFNATIDGIGAWEVDVPHISGTFSNAAAWRDTRCSVDMSPTHSSAFSLTKIWQGNNIHIPGGGDRVMLVAEVATPAPMVHTWHRRQLLAAPGRITTVMSKEALALVPSSSQMAVAGPTHTPVPCGRAVHSGMAIRSRAALNMRLSSQHSLSWPLAIRG